MTKVFFAFAMLSITCIMFVACKKDKPVNSDVTNPTDSTNYFTDPRDGQTYAIVQIGNQWWMAENLNFEVENSRCYGNNPNNCNAYGRLYDWHTAQMACPPGWHLPSDSEWTELVNFLGGAEVAGGKMKDTTSWYAPNSGASNSSAFSGLPGGLHYIDEVFLDFGYFGIWWSSTEYHNGSAWNHYLYYNDELEHKQHSDKENGYSVRCVRD